MVVSSCLAHVINLATQALIRTYSKSPHFDPKNPDAHVPASRDEVGLIRAIVVKERSSSKRKEMWTTVQSKVDNSNPTQLLLDMKVRWSSTYVMLDRAERKKECVDNFVDELRWEETDSAKCDKIHELKLDSEEWERVRTFLSLLSHADNAQQAFSTEKASTLHLAIPALEALHKAWSTPADRLKYDRFAPALGVACTKIDDYYEKTTNSPAYIVAMILDPREKMGHFKKHWPVELQAEVIECMEAFKERYYAFHGQSSSKPSIPPRKTKLRTLLRELSDDEDCPSANAGPAVLADPNRPWLFDFRAYFDTFEHVPDGWTTIAWWGVNAHRYEIWASLARDYLSIMASSVSSERAFSQGGITISKRQNCLKGDIVEALQTIKCAIRRDLLFRDVSPSSVLEAQLDGEGEELDEDNGNESGQDEEGWDELLIEEEDNSMCIESD